MSVDNSAILWLGLPANELIDLDQSNDYDETLSQYLRSFNSDDLGYRNTNNDGILVGFELGDSGSYSMQTFNHLDFFFKFGYCTSCFRRIFNKEPKVYLFNYQH